MNLPSLNTARLTLRPPTAQDAGFITQTMQDRAVWEWLSVIPQPYTQDHALHFIEQIAPGDSWLIEMAGSPCGVIGGAQGELGYWLVRSAWGQGIVTEAGKAVVDHFFAQGGTIMTSGYFCDNDRSRRVLEKLGFSDAGPKTLGCLSDGRENIPSRHMTLTRAQWQAKT